MMNFSENTLKMILKSVELSRNKSECSSMENCQERPLYRTLMGIGCQTLFAFAVFGNCMNLFIYRSAQIRHYTAIRMLSAKLALRLSGHWEYGSGSDRLYWTLWPFQTYLVNAFGFCAMWLTVLMIAECFAHVFFPSQSKSLCSTSAILSLSLVISAFALLLPLTYPLNRVVDFFTCQNGAVRVHITSRQGWLLLLLEKLTAIGGLFLAIALPLSLLVFMTGALVWRLLVRQSPAGAKHLATKRAVTRITLITTALQLITEIPAVPVFVYAAVQGPEAIQSEGLCLLQTVSHFLSLCNASLSFFVYIALSHRFRHLLVARMHRSSGCCATVTHGEDARSMITRGTVLRTSQETNCSNPSPRQVQAVMHQRDDVSNQFIHLLETDEQL